MIPQHPPVTRRLMAKDAAANHRADFVPFLFDTLPMAMERGIHMKSPVINMLSEDLTELPYISSEQHKKQGDKQ